MSESASKAFDLLFHLARTGSAPLARIAKDTSWDKATALRYLTALEKKGVVERRDNAWTLGLALLELANHVPVTENIARRAKPVLEELARRTGESANLSAMVGADLMYLAKADSDRALRLRTNPGDRLPLYCTAGGKCILSRLPQAARNQYMHETKLKAVAPCTLTDAQKLLQEIDITIKRGWAIDNEELEPGLICYAMPLDLPRYGFNGAVSVSGPSGRMKSAEQSVLDGLRWATDELRAYLSGNMDRESPELFSPARGGFKNSDWNRSGSEFCE